ncbi:E3 ubiquitin-protein ligase SHPRH [Choloepus didactylus]|uniref:E3 ubiquitin-protein ligase SHPRH n=1 Tax=Choloepus didactylus TaxID=27675 RepID=UPI00189D0D37|nr:E3 ubiquitin-protein ligase SHPRH [Choloepus didactylus]XP_037698190.1 E3 ubiquitin-protein ligase SHPRH [Choloepus didactylus]XP_037698191.1 E3 ubiquitin-protein ligase SHPRH [Choloepus didactylus]XP_037698192.1 E3 ubiquitin-protein ligase SHPRH [Choloepus didactylus]
MSSRRKRAPPVRVDEERQRQLCWNMHEDRRNEPLLPEEDEQLCPGPELCAAHGAVLADVGDVAHRDKKQCSEAVSVSESSRKEETAGIRSPSFVKLEIEISPYHLDNSWKALLGELTLQLFPEQGLVEHLSGRSLTLVSSEASSQLLVCVHSDCGDVEKPGRGLQAPASAGGRSLQVESSFSADLLEDLGWLQKKRRIKLYQRPEGGRVIKVGIYLLEAGLAKLDYLSDANSRMKKFNQLMKRVMEKLYNFIPDAFEEGEEGAESEPEGQDIDELYCFVKQAHEQEARPVHVDVQHPALIPVLRPYQREAVTWMLQQERFRGTPASENALHFLWREILTCEGLKLYYNPYTGCFVREHPWAGPPLLGGILADEMGLGKTVEVLALILTHTRQDIRQNTPALPEGKAVNYFIPSHYAEGKVKNTETRNMEFEPKEKVQCPPTRVMILTAVKEMTGKRGVSIFSIYKYVRAVFGCDVRRNRGLLKRVLKCLLLHGLLRQVKGHGFSGTFALGKNYKEEDIYDRTKKQVVGSPRKIQKESRKSGNKDTDSEYLPSNTSDEDDNPYYYYDKVRRNRSKLRKKPVPLTKQGDSELNVHPAAQSHCLPASDSGDTDIAASRSSCVSVAKQEPGAGADVPPAPVKSPFESPGYHFECICGELDQEDCKPRVQCLKCQLWQHAACVNYEAEHREVTPFYCPHCLVAMEPVSTGATLIISPSSICHQWVEEISRHVQASSLRVLVYQGVKKDGFLQPHFLAEQDIVIITYDVLRSELNYVDIPHSSSEDGRRLRNQKRYMAIPSPLVAVEWWRICLDEAQMVECPAVKAAEMAQRLSGINRWCVSGTPVQRGLEDLFGLVVFLGVEPFCVRHWWTRLLYRPYCRRNPQPLYSFIAKILWRSAKKDVIDQIQIPPQTEEMHRLHFSPVERHFYHRQHEACCRDAVAKLRRIADWALRLSSLDRRTVSSILYPLLRLRQACCHPQAVRGEFLPLQKSTMTMEELLTSLQKKCGTECEEAHRQLVCALNGLAGIHIIQGEFASAADLYREVLRSSEEHRGKLKTDSLQRLHATHNLMELLAAGHPGIPPTLRDSRLEEEAQQLREHYMSKCNAEVAEAQQALQLVQQAVRELQRKVRANSPWWLNVIHRAIEFAIEEELAQRVRNEITSNYKQQTGTLSMSEKFHDCRGLQFLLTTQMEELSRFQKLVREAVKSLEGPPSRSVIESATVCHLRPARLPLNCCAFCKADELFTEYESKLFSHTVKGQTAIFEEMIEDEEGLVDDRLPTTSRGLWAASETERSLKAVLAFARSHRLDAELIEEGSASMDLFEVWKKEYKLLHEYWMALRNRVSAVDELAMATERLRLRHPREPRPSPPGPHIIEPHEVEQNRIKLLNDKAVATSQLQKKLGQLLYLTNLEKSQDKTSGGINPEPCPICARQLGKQWAVLTCGHCFCNECVSIMIEQYSVGSHRSAIRCAICRQTTPHKDISYVFTSEVASCATDLPVKGSHSTKVEAVVRTLMKIQLRDPGAKALVFSTWQDVLDIISKALSDNNMEFAQISRVKTFQENLSAFKHDPKVNILLLPLHTGSNGLTLIEATHVLLVEPILNPARELQAIGRVHRIGQTKPTIVHRFLIKATIEERMQAMLKTVERSHTSPSGKHSEASTLTVADLADLFTTETEELE